MSARTLKVDQPPMKGEDVEAWQRSVRWRFRSWGIDIPVKVDGIYGLATRSATASLLYAFGVAQGEMAGGVTPALRTKIRNRRFSALELARFAGRVGYRRRLRRRYAGGGVAKPVNRIIADSWGYHPPVHDGIDVICAPQATLYAMVRSRVLRADTGGWWGKGPSGDTSKGDGVIVLEVLDDIGPFRKGLRLVYGHAERPKVRVGEIVQAGEPIGVAGLAVAYHIHLCVNRRRDAKGVGDHDPRRYLTYVKRHG